MSKSHTVKPVESLTEFSKEEEKLLKHWYESGIVDKYLQKNNQAKKTFSFMDGPITANNPMGVHHGWGRTYKDLYQRYYNLKGYKQRFQNGFDSQGLWVEVEVEKDLGFKNKKDIEKYGVAKFVKKCKSRVKQFSDIQTKQSKRLGYFMDWDHSYFTMSDANNYMIWHFLKTCNTHGWLYKGKESVPWCPRCQTAISQHEMLTEDYQQVTHKSIYFILPLNNRNQEFLLVWTTTPWTLPANIAVAVDKKIDYSIVQGESGDKFWVAKDCVDRVFGNNHKNIIKTVKGKELVGLKYSGPFDHLPAVKTAASESDLFHTVIATDPLIMPINTDEGTGMVHTAVSAGTEDFKLGKKLGLPMIPVIADNADYLDGLGFLTGKNAKNHPEIILDYLVNEDAKEYKDWVFKIEDYTHRYPGCWRCKTELVWKVTDEWYIAMDKKSKLDDNPDTLRQRMIKVAKAINWIPSFGLDRELDWLNNMHDWLISKKNRYWGLCLPIWECDDCQSFKVIDSKEELEKSAVEGWEKFKGHSPHKPYVDYIKMKCSECGLEMSRIEPVGNPWLDAGIVSFSTIAKENIGKPLYLTDKKAWQQWHPADFITESFPGQFKNWFYSMIAMSSVLENQAPYKTCFGFATLLAEDGRPMHKSWGNMIEFNQGADKIGADVMRWLYARQNPAANLLFGYNIAADVKRQFHLILWNSYRFFANYASIDNWSPIENEPLLYTVLDKWILSRLSYTIKDVEASLDKYDAFHATKSLEQFVSDLSTWYIRRSRDRVGPNALNAKDKHVCYSVLHTVLKNLTIILSPFIPFISDRIYTNITGEESVHLADWPELNLEAHPQLEERVMEARRAVEKAHAIRKEKGIRIRQPLSRMTISSSVSSPKQNLLEVIAQEVNVKQVIWEIGDELSVDLNTKLTPELIEEGKARDIIRQVQNARKKTGTAMDEEIDLVLPDWPKSYEAEIKTKVLAKIITKGDELTVIRRTV